MASMKVQLTMDEELVKLIDAKAKSLFTTRSGYISMKMAEIVTNENKVMDAIQLTLNNAIDEESKKKLK